MPRALTLFERAVARVVRRIPRGTTLGYVQYERIDVGDTDDRREQVGACRSKV